MKQQNHQKLSDKAFARLIGTSILGVLVCLACLCSTTWAWFTQSVPSNNNQIKTAGSSLLTITVYDDDAATEDLILGPTVAEKTLELTEGTYEVTLSLPGDSASGYCLMKAGGKSYYSAFIQRHEEITPKTLSFFLKVETGASVELQARWGMFSGTPDVVAGGELVIPTPSNV